MLVVMDPGHQRESLSSPSQSFSTADKSASKSDTSMCTRFALSGTIRSFRSRSRRWCDSPRLSLARFLDCVAVIVVTVDFGVLSAFMVATLIYLCASLVVLPGDTVPATWRAILAEGALLRRPLAIIDLPTRTPSQVLRTMG